MPDDANWIPPEPWKIDYRAVVQRRIKTLTNLRAEPHLLGPVRDFYRADPIQFIEDWGVTYDPRLAGTDSPSSVPFILFPKQREFLQWVLDLWREKKPGIAEKSRDCGVSWCCMALACTLCIFEPGFAVGFGSRKQEYVDQKDDPKSLFWKGRMFMSALPREFRAGWTEEKHAPFMRLIFPESGASITGEAGDGIGRGDRKAIYFVDEAAYLEHPQLADAGLASTTNCRIDVSSVNGMANSFAAKRWGGRIPVFIFDWRDDPRKDDAWYAKQVEDLDNPVIVAQEIDRNYHASAEGQLIPSSWVQAAVDAHLKLGFNPCGVHRGSLDVADEGMDANAFCGSYGAVIDKIETWSGAGSDIFATTTRAFAICDRMGYDGFEFDSDGLGADVRGDARIINQTRLAAGQPQLRVTPFRGSAAVENPDGQDVPGRLNKDFFANMKAQGWWRLRTRFHKTFKAVEEMAQTGSWRGDPDELISISSTCGPNGTLPLKLMGELSQVTYTVNTVGKVVIDKTPDGARSPNEADAVMIRYSGHGAGTRVSSEALAAIRAMGMRRR